MNKSKKSSKTSLPTMPILRHLFNIGCRNLGLTKECCLNLTLLLNSRVELATMICWMLEEEKAGRKPTTTEVVLYAEKIKEMVEQNPELAREMEKR